MKKWDVKLILGLAKKKKLNAGKATRADRSRETGKSRPLRARLIIKSQGEKGFSRTLQLEKGNYERITTEGIRGHMFYFLELRGMLIIFELLLRTKNLFSKYRF